MGISRGAGGSGATLSAPAASPLPAAGVVSPAQKAQEGVWLQARCPALVESAGAGSPPGGRGAGCSVRLEGDRVCKQETSLTSC